MNDLEKLLAEFEAYKQKTELKLKLFERQIKELQKAAIPFKEVENKPEAQEEVESAQVYRPAIQERIIDAKEEGIPETAHSFPKEKQPTYIAQIIEKKHNQKIEQEGIPKPNKALEFIKTLMNAVFGGSLEYVKSIYINYKDEGKLQVFFMTIAGIAAILFGSGYLLQYAFATWFISFTPLIKTMLGFAVTISIGIVGLRLFNTKKTYKEYGSALIALSLCLNYLLIYFLVSSYTASAPYYVLGYVFMTLNTLMLLVSALHTETKIIAVLTLLGGTFSPLFIHGESIPLYYYVHLWILYVLLIGLSVKIKWKTLKDIIIVCGLFVIEAGIFSDNSSISELWRTLISHAFIYLFAYSIASKNLNTLKRKLSTKDSVSLVSIIVIHCFNLYYISGFDYTSNLLAAIYWFNALPFCFLLFSKFNELSKPYRAILFSISGSLIALGIAVFFDKEYISLFWSVEAILLMYAGCVYSDRIIRIEAFVIYILALAQSLVLIPELESLWDSAFLWGNWLPIIGIWMASFGSHIVLSKVTTHLSLKDKYLSLFYLEFTIIFGSIVLAVPFIWYFNDWVLYPIVGILFANLIVSKSRKVSLSLIWNSSILLILFINITLNLAEVITLHWSTIWDYPASYQFLGISLILFLAFIGSKKWLSDRYELLPGTLLQFAFLFLGLNIILIGLSFLDVYFFPISLAVALFYLHLSTKLKSKILSIFSFILFGFLLAGYANSVHETGAFHFTAQTMYGKMCVIEIGAVLFYLQGINEKWLIQISYERPFYLLKTLFYLLIPVVIITLVNRHLHDYVAHSTWISLLLAFIAFEATKRKPLVIEFYIILMFSTLLSLWWLEIPVYLIALLVLFGIHYYKKGFKKSGMTDPNWSKLFSFNYYFLGLVLYLGFLKFLDSNQIIALSGLGIYFLALIRFRSLIFPLWKHEKALHILSSIWLFTTVSIVGVASWKALDFVGLTLLILNFAFYIYVVYGKFIKYLKNAFWPITIIFIHALSGILYYQILESFFPIHFQTLLTIVLVLHGIILLFHTLKGGWGFLRNLYIPLFAIILLKLFFFDLQGFSIIQKILVLILSGIFFLVGAWAFIKLKERYEVNKE